MGTQKQQFTYYSFKTRVTVEPVTLQEVILSCVKMNQEKLKAMQESVRIGGKGTARRKKKVTHRTATTDDKKLQSSLKKLSVNNIPGIEEVNMMKNDGSVIHFNNPKVQASLAANTFAVTVSPRRNRSRKCFQESSTSWAP